MPALIKVEETGQNEQQFFHAKLSQTCTIFCQTKLLKQPPKSPFSFAKQQLHEDIHQAVT